MNFNRKNLCQHFKTNNYALDISEENSLEAFHQKTAASVYAWKETEVDFHENSSREKSHEKREREWKIFLQ